jgi:hypothetical protein
VVVSVRGCSRPPLKPQRRRMAKVINRFSKTNWWGGRFYKTMDPMVAWVGYDKGVTTMDVVVGRFESQSRALIPVPGNGGCCLFCLCILKVTLDQERRFWVKRWKQTRAPKPSRKHPAVVGSGTGSNVTVADPWAPPNVYVPVKSIGELPRSAAA